MKSPIKKQYRNKISILGDSLLFTFHLTSFLALGHTQVFLKVVFLLLTSCLKTIVWLP